jgi:hypothetical protein
MSLLDRWRRFAQVGTVIECPAMRLDARDWEDPVVVGSGEIRVKSASAFEYVLRGVPKDVGHVLRCLHRQQVNRYDGLMRMRLNVTDDAGVSIGAGWTVPEVKPGMRGEAWTFTGETESLWMDDDKAGEVGTEVLFETPRHHCARQMLARFVSGGNRESGSVARHEVEVLDTCLEFSIDGTGDWLRIYARASEGLPQTVTENWLGEPLRIVFGQLAYPRIVARANPDRTIISIRPSPRWYPASDWTALWSGPDALSDKEGFWRTYADLLSYVARARDREGRPNFEPNKVTALYQKVIQACRGSRWVCALTLTAASKA